MTCGDLRPSPSPALAASTQRQTEALAALCWVPALARELFSRVSARVGARRDPGEQGRLCHSDCAPRCEAVSGATDGATGGAPGPSGPVRRPSAPGAMGTASCSARANQASKTSEAVARVADLVRALEDGGDGGNVAALTLVSFMDAPDVDRAAVRDAILACDGLEASVHLYASTQEPGTPPPRRVGSLLLLQGIQNNNGARWVIMCAARQVPALRLGTCTNPSRRCLAGNMMKCETHHWRRLPVGRPLPRARSYRWEPPPLLRV